MTASPGVLPAWAQITPQRRGHIARVTLLLNRWADAMGVPERERRRWITAANLHDSLKDAPRSFLEELVPAGWSVDVLLHGPAAAVLAERDGESDQGVLNAVRYHSVGYAGWDSVGRMLYLADYLEPGRGFNRAHRAELAARVPGKLPAVLCEVAEERIRATLERGVRLRNETIAFWSGLQCDDSLLELVQR